MDIAFLAAAFTHTPVATVTLSTGKHDEAGAKEIELRWRSLADQLRSDGVDDATLSTLEVEVTALTEGPAPEGLVLVASGETLLLRHELIEPPVRDEASWEALPHVAEVIRQGSRSLPHLIVTVDRLGGTIRRYGPFSEEVASVGITGGDWPIRKVHPGGWSENRFENAVENQWEANLGAVADDVNRLVKATDVELVVVAGDVRAKQLLEEHLSEAVTALVRQIDRPGDDEPTPEVIAEQVLEAAAEVTTSALEEARRAIGQGSDGAGGLEEVCRALQRSQVDTLLLGEKLLDAGSTLHVGPTPTEVAVSVDGIAEGPVNAARAADALIRAAVATGARVLVAADDALPAPDVVATLRYADAATH